jgi:penicillin-binding protein 1A
MKIFSRQVFKTPLFRRVVRVILLLLAIAVVGAGIAAGTALVVYHQLSGAYDLSKLGQMPSRSEVLDADGKPYGRLQSDQNRVIVPLKDMSPQFVEAILTREDARFREHRGVDPRGIARAVVHNLRNGGAREGASTITQQLARNTFALGGQTLHRKLLEAMVAGRIEDKYSKEQILEFYLNRIYLGAGAYGIEAAAQRYFDKSSRQLTLGESAMLAGIVRNPNRNSPLRNLAGAKEDRDTVLERMAELKKISAQEAAAAKAEPVRLRTRPAPAQDDYVMDAVRGELDDLVSSEQINQGGLHIYTTIDSRLQRRAVESLEQRLEQIERSKNYGHLTRDQYLAKADAKEKTSSDASPEYLQAALLAVDNSTGAIVAMVGGRNFEESHYNRALYAKRQIGSTFKPFVYAAAFERGMLPSSLVDDSPLRPGEIHTASNAWKPGNSDGRFLGPQRAELGLIQSRNLMSIRIGEWAGMESVLSMAKRVGLKEVAAMPSVYLGSFETTLKSLTGAYTMFPNHGVARTPYFIERIDAANGQVIYQAPHEGRKATSALVTQQTSDILERVMTEGTARQASALGFRLPAAGKTGTTNDYKDAWFVGYTTSLTCGVWVGLDKPQTITAKGYGSALALPIWVEFMQEATGVAKRYPALALHGQPAAADPVRVAATQPLEQEEFVRAENAQASVSVAQLPPPLEAPSVSAPDAAPPVKYEMNDPGSRLILDPKTGRVIGIDGSAGAAAEAQRSWPRAQAVPVQPAAPALSANAPVRRAQPVISSQTPGAPSWQTNDTFAPRTLPGTASRPSRTVIYDLSGRQVIVRNRGIVEEE